MDLDAPDKAVALIEAGRNALVRFETSGFSRLEPAILQPSAAFLDLLGEELKSHLLLTGEGGEFCLRPEYTIPVCRAYLASGQTGQEARFCYFGPVFLGSAPAPQELRQVGLEWFGGRDLEAADAQILALSLEAARIVGHGDLKVRLGDARLLNEVLDRLGVSQRWARRIRRGLAKGLPLANLLPQPGEHGPLHGGVLAAMERSDHEGARSLVQDLLAISGIRPIGGRSIGEISERLLAKADNGANDPLAGERRAVVETFLRVRGDPDAAVLSLRSFAKDAKIDLEATLDRLESRLGFIAALGLDLEDMEFATNFFRPLDYYSGFLFDAASPTEPGVTIAGGGRYDALARALGAPSNVPAVGAMVSIDSPLQARTGP